MKQPGGLTRREFVVALGGASAIPFLMTGTEASAAAADTTFDGMKFDDLILVRRAEDFLYLSIGLLNAEVRQAGPHDSATALLLDGRHEWRIVRKNAGPFAVVLLFPSQHLAEQSFNLVANEVREFPAKTIVAHSSRLAFGGDESKLSNDHRLGIPVRLPWLFAKCREWGLLLPARDAAAAAAGPPAPGLTAIEYPTRLQIAPATTDVILEPDVTGHDASDVDTSGFRYANDTKGLPATILPDTTGRDVLWSVDLTSSGPREFFGAFSRGDQTSDPPFAVGGGNLTGLLRDTIVAETRAPQNPPLAIKADAFRLSALGASTAVAFARTPDPNNAFISWSNRSQELRDDFIQIAYAGFLLPFGLRAEYVTTVTRRPYKFRQTIGFNMFEQYVGVLDRRVTIRLIDDHRDYTGAAARAAAMQRVSVGPKESAPIFDAYANSYNELKWGGFGNKSKLPSAFLPILATDGTPLTWKVTVTGVSGESITSEKPLIFMVLDADRSQLQKVKDAYGPPNAAAAMAVRDGMSVHAGQLLLDDSRLLRVVKDGAIHHGEQVAAATSAMVTSASFNSFAFNGAAFTYVAREAEATAEDLLKNRAANALRAIAHQYDLDFTPDPNLGFVFTTTLGSATVVIPTAEAMGAVEAGKAAILKLTDEYKAPLEADYQKFRQSQNKVYAAIAGLEADFSREGNELRAGVVAMKSTVAALSQEHGALVAAAGEVPAVLKSYKDDAAVELKKLLGLGAAELQSKLLGIVSLSDLLHGSLNLSDPAFPKFKVTRENNGTVRARYALDTTLNPLPGTIEPRDGGNGGIKLHFRAETTVRPGSAPTKSLSIHLDPFRVAMPPKNLNLGPLSEIAYLNFTGFDATIGDGTTIMTPQFDGVTINDKSALAFLSELSQFLGLGNTFTVGFDVGSIAIGMNFALPSIALGALSITNLALKISTLLPISGNFGPTFKFELSSPIAPFSVRVAFLGGGGWFRLALSPFVDAAAVAHSQNGGSLLSIGGGIDVSAGVEINLAGVVHGYIAVYAGVYFDMALNPADSSKNYCTFGGILVAAGGIEAFHLISASMYVMFKFEYSDRDGGSLHGSAEYHIEVHMLFFNMSFSASVEYSVHLGGGGPRQTALRDKGSWWEEHLAREALFA